jgi:hypothetical protein
LRVLRNIDKEPWRMNMLLAVLMVPAFAGTGLARSRTRGVPPTAAAETPVD